MKDFASNLLAVVFRLSSVMLPNNRHSFGKRKKKEDLKNY